MGDEFESLGPMLADLGGEIADIVGGQVDGALLYVEAGEGWASAAIFRDEGDAIRYFDPSSELFDLIHELWNAQEPSKRWAVMEYVVEGTKFDAQFLYPEQIDPEESEVERRPRALKRRFGDKPVIYPPVPSIE